VLEEEDAAEVDDGEDEIEVEVVVEVVVEGLELHPAKIPRATSAATPKAKTLAPEVGPLRPKGPPVPPTRQPPLMSEPPSQDRGPPTDRTTGYL
jgi:hypothetical protein